ncbi:unnamed protein product [Parnassius mnemosyne]|uniref:GIY-YIG homing endonuclease n=1 Tax=Parnassius mnemosyne TaxID=213953 RepID=A0AAV1LM46_9NEOP
MISYNRVIRVIKRDENLFSIVENICTQVGYTIPKHQINYIARVPTHFGKDKSIIVNFINRYIKEEFVAAARAKKFMTAKDIGEKWTKNDTEWYPRDGKKRKGRQKLRWENDIKQIATTTWQRKAANKEIWKTLGVDYAKGQADNNITDVED